MKKVLCYILFVFVTSIIISCKPSFVTDAKIEAKYSYTSDQDAIMGVLKDVYKIERRNNLPEIANILKSGFFEEEKEIGEWLKIKFGLEIRKGEAIKIIYTYKGENAGFDILYKPYNNDVFPKNITSGYDFVTKLGNNDNSPQDKPKSNNSSRSSKSTSTSTNRLANTKWQDIDDQRYYMTFGQNSFSYRSGSGITSGSYTINGDTVNFTFENIGWGGNKETGALIGNELTAFYTVFRRVE